MEQTSEFPSAMKEYYDGRYILQTDAPNIPYHYFDLTDSYTKLLLHFIGVNTSTTVIDSSDSAHVITAVANAQLKTDQYKFGTSSLYLDGAGDYISALDNADWFYDTSAFTIDMWIRCDGAPAADFIFYNQYADANNYIQFYWDSVNEGLRFVVVSASVILANYFVEWIPVTATWYHIALTRYLNNMTYFVDGVTSDWTGINTAITTTTSFPNLAAIIKIGETFKGWMCEARISKGVARWSTGFTPATTYYGYIKSSCLQADSYISLSETVAPSTLIGAASIYVKASDGNLYYKDSAGAEALIGAAGGNGQLCSFYVEQTYAIATGIGPYTLPHTPIGDSGTDGDGNDYHKVQVIHGASPQKPVQITSLVGDQLTLAFAPTSGFFVLFTW